MGLALAVIVETSHAPGTEAIDIEIMAALGSCAEDRHNMLPFMSVGFDAVPIQPVGGQVGGFMRNRLGQEILGVADQDGRVVANPRRAVGMGAQLSRRLSTQIEADLREQ